MRPAQGLSAAAMSRAMIIAKPLSVHRRERLARAVFLAPYSIAHKVTESLSFT